MGSREESIVRFWDKVYKTPSCWLWQGALGSHRYGIFRFEGKPQLAHRMAWIFTYEQEPGELLHSCDVRHCVNPEHLSTGTHQDNVQDAQRKGRMGPARKFDPESIRYLLSEGFTQAELVRDLHSSPATISRIANYG